MSMKMLDGVTAVGASTARISSMNAGAVNHTVQAHFRSRGTTEISAVTVKFQGSLTGEGADDSVLSNPTMSEGTTTDRIATVAFDFIIAGTSYTKAVEAAGSEMSAAHVVSATKFGVVLVDVNESGTISSRVALATQAYATAELAHVAADAVAAPVQGVINIGRILIEADAGAWTANTDDFSTDLTNAVFLSNTSDFQDLASHDFTGAEITAQKATFHAADKGAIYTRVYLSTLTGTGIVDVWMHDVEVR